ncbi:hypothetical protein [Clostridium sp.]|uniref:hypothetical protein n=1 Tax=Clostridium sp. TaxID=1506 RepID=UPI002610B124|nr:hypothetical protein [Clostridium sp.]
MKSIIILILVLLFVLYLYREFQLRFGYEIDKDTKILEILIFLLSIYAFISRKWWINILVLILIIALIISPRKFINPFRKIYNKFTNLYKKQKN